MTSNYFDNNMQNFTETSHFPQEVTHANLIKAQQQINYAQNMHQHRMSGKYRLRSDQLRQDISDTEI